MLFFCVMVLPQWCLVSVSNVKSGVGASNRHCSDVIMSSMTSWITSLTIVYSIVYSGPDQRKHQSSTSLAFVRESHRWPVNSPHKGPVTRKKFPFYDVTMLGKNIRRHCRDVTMLWLGSQDTQSITNFLNMTLARWRDVKTSDRDFLILHFWLIR